MNDPQENKWKVESLRCTVFPLHSVVDQASNVWQSLIKSVPEQIRNQPKQQTTTVEGEWTNVRMRLDIRNNQLDWRVLPNPHAIFEGLRILGPYDKAPTAFQRLMQQWLTSDCPPTNRIAYGAVLLQPQDSRVSVNEALNSLLPAVDIDPKDTWDFSYKINRRRDLSNIGRGLQINRISTWSAVEIFSAHVEIKRHDSPDGPLKTQRVLPVCRLELDINTVVEHSNELKSQDLNAVFNELVESANEIAVAGDII